MSIKHEGHTNPYCFECEMAVFTQKAMTNGMNPLQFAHALTHEASLMLQYTIEHSVFSALEMPSTTTKTVN